MEDFYPSILRIVHDPDGTPTTLLDYGDLVDGELVSLKGSQYVETVRGLRVAGVKTFPRGNDSHSYEFTVVVPEASRGDAAASVLNYPATLPRTAADVEITVQGMAGSWRILNASIESWEPGFKANLMRRVLRIVGGEIQTV